MNKALVWRHGPPRRLHSTSEALHEDLLICVLPGRRSRPNALGVVPVVASWPRMAEPLQERLARVSIPGKKSVDDWVGTCGPLCSELRRSPRSTQVMNGKNAMESTHTMQNNGPAALGWQTRHKHSVLRIHDSTPGGFAFFSERAPPARACGSRGRVVGVIVKRDGNCNRRAVGVSAASSAV